MFSRLRFGQLGSSCGWSRGSELQLRDNVVGAIMVWNNNLLCLSSNLLRGSTRGRSKLIIIIPLLLLSIAHCSIVNVSEDTWRMSRPEYREAAVWSSKPRNFRRIRWGEDSLKYTVNNLFDDLLPLMKFLFQFLHIKLLLTQPNTRAFLLILSNGMLGIFSGIILMCEFQIFYICCTYHVSELITYFTLRNNSSGTFPIAR